MTEPGNKNKFPLTLHMNADLAKRLAVAAEAQKRSAEDLVINLLERNLPRLQTGESKGKIPYT
jgi:predicted HicB family RNase H-like nuclease